MHVVIEKTESDASIEKICQALGETKVCRLFILNELKFRVLKKADFV